MISALVFDLDGTLYVNDLLGGEIQKVACRYLAELRRIDTGGAAALLEATRKSIAAVTGRDATLSQAWVELGGSMQDLHRRFAAEIRPERFLARDNRVINLLRALTEKFELYIYTNNNGELTGRILETLGLPDLFRDIFTIEFSWSPKPDPPTLERLLEKIGKTPGECLFVGDRYDVDLRLPATLGCEVRLVGSINDLLHLESLLHEEKL